MFPGQAPAGFDDLIQRKYNILQQNANAQSIDAAARANLANAQAGQVAPLAGAQIKEAGARSDLYGKQGQESQARSGLYNAQAGVVGPTAQANINEANARTGLFGAQSQFQRTQNQYYPQETQARIGLQNSEGLLQRSQAQSLTAHDGDTEPEERGAIHDALMRAGNYGQVPAPVPSGPVERVVPKVNGAGQFNGAYGPHGFDDDDDGQPLHFRTGTASVPAAKGMGMKDTVKAKLAPGEAVLNAPAAEMMGRGLIAHANAMGMAKMGMVAPPGPQGKTPGYKHGTSKVGSKKAPAMDAAALTSALQAMGAMGGGAQGGPPQAGPAGPGPGMGMGLPGPGAQLPPMGLR